MKQFEEELLKDDWTQVRPEVEVKKVAIPQGEETYILCRTAGRKEKEKAIRNRFSTRMEDALKRLAKTIATGRLKDRNKMERRLGRIQASHSQVNDLYEVALRDTPEGVRLFWEIKEDRKVWRGLREGAYMLRTNLQAGTAEELWSRYMQLTEAEASFRALKSELSIRPLFHQKEPRVKAHVMVAFLGYALWVTLKHLLKRRPAIVPQPSSQRSQQRAAVIGDEGSRSAFHIAERRHRPAHHRRSRDSSASHHRTHRRAEIAPATTRPQPPRTASNSIANVV